MTVTKTRKTAHIVDTVDDLDAVVAGKADANHNHDSTYAAIVHNHDGTYATASHNHDSAYAAASHNHDSSYAAASHNHDSSYAAASHNHDSSYAATSHNHNADYAAINHNHDGTYAAASHNHDSAYAAAGHNHDSDYASASHNHDSDYAAASHTHANATASAAGFMSTTQATRVNNMRENAGAGLTKDSNQRFTHGNTSSVGATANTGANVVNGATFDEYGHVQTHTSIEITPTLIGAAATSHNHDSSYAAASHNHDSAYAAASHNHDSSYAAASHTHNLTDITVDGSLNMGSNSITGITNLSSNSLILASGGTLTSSANWTQGGTSSFSGATTVNADLKVNDGAITIESDDRSANDPTFSMNALAESGSDVDRGFSMAFDQSDSKKFEIYFPDIDSDGGKQRVVWQDTNGDFFIQPKGVTTTGLRIVNNGTFQFGFNASTNGSDLLGTSTTGEGFQIRDDGWTAISSGHSRVVDINRRSTTGEAIRFRDEGSYAGAFTYTNGVIGLSTPSDKRTKENIEDMTGALDVIKTLNPKYYFQFGNMRIRKPGLIAQEVDKNQTFRHSVTTCQTEEYDNFKCINYTYFIPHMIGAIKELSEKIDRLEERIASM